ncbi:uncharacterized protein N7515_008824 [Penicillium bovifimosum]|uniref:NAD-dependent epimerase/dehydratase domain-containing protein n=1 Tax=Penicillium bovifimosum TaxID=126998 RepID=A0A9W9GNZ8_9EURO|nr:uncharacterized protein N7515_008824 [Penicillium bovifimosum]KAJ5124999.1 hypothetical protein N7515_008824 [Penicillium bovifimosum]
MAEALYYLPKGSRILVTGANGFVGSNVIHNLLELGFRVRGTVRAAKPWLDKMFQDKFGADSYESVILTSFENVDILVEVLDGVSGVAHVATDTSFKPNVEEVVGWAVRAIHNLLEAASRHSDIKRVVMTSSAIAALFPVSNKEITVSEDSWNDEAITTACDPNTPDRLKGFFGYAASKTAAEKAAWKWMKENNPGFQFNTVLPDFTLGRVLHKEMGGSTMAWVRGLVEGDRLIFETFVPQEYFVDVGDIARLHAAALLDPNTVSRRLFGFAAPVNLTDIISTVRKLRPESTSIPEPPVDEGRDLSVVLPAKEAERLLKEFCGRDGWTSMEESIAHGLERC